jgi:flagellin
MSIIRINTNTDALQAIADLNANQDLITQTIRRLSTGLRINTAEDDPSGIAIAGAYRTQMSGTESAITNAQTGLSMLQTADNALNQTTTILLRMQDLAVKAANTATITTASITQINTELQSLKDEITRQASSVTFNSQPLFSGGFANGKTLQVGPDNNTAYLLTVVMQAVDLANLFFVSNSIWGDGATTGPGSLAISNFAGVQSATGYAQMAMTYVNSAINIVSNVRATIGVQETRLNAAISNLTNSDTNLASALSNIRDADMASEIATLAKLQVLSQFNISAMAQANVAPRQLLTLMSTQSG